jgi:hypothetical protein
LGERPDDNEIIILKHMDSTGLMWLNAEMFKKHKIAIAPKYAHLLSNATGPKPKMQKSKKIIIWFFMHASQVPFK